MLLNTTHYHGGLHFLCLARGPGISTTRDVARPALGSRRQADTYYENVHRCIDRFDFVMANPPFNVDGVDKDKIKDDKRYPFGMPRVRWSGRSA